MRLISYEAVAPAQEGMEIMNASANTAEQVINPDAAMNVPQNDNEKPMAAEERWITPLSWRVLRQQIDWGRDLSQWRRLQATIQSRACNITCHKWWQQEVQNLTNSKLMKHTLGRMAYALIEGCYPQWCIYGLLPLGLGDLTTGESLYLSLNRVDGKRWLAGKPVFLPADMENSSAPLQEWEHSPEDLIVDASLCINREAIVRYCQLEEVEHLRSVLLAGWNEAKNYPEGVQLYWEWRYQDFGWRIPVQWGRYHSMEIVYQRAVSKYTSQACYRFVRLM